MRGTGKGERGDSDRDRARREGKAWLRQVSRPGPERGLECVIAAYRYCSISLLQYIVIAA